MRRIATGLVIATVAGLAHGLPIGSIDTVAGGGLQEGVNALAVKFAGPKGVVVDSLGNTYVADTANARVRKILPDGTTHTAWEGSTAHVLTYFPLYYDGPMNCPGDLAADSSGNVYFADPCDAAIRKIDSSGQVTLFAGVHPSSPDQPTGDNGLATAAPLAFPSNVAVDASGTVFIAEPGAFRIRKVSGGIITTVPGSLNPFMVNLFLLNGPIAADNAGGVYAYIPDHVAQMPLPGSTPSHWPGGRVIHVDAAGVTTIVAGEGGTANSGDGGLASAAGIGTVQGLTLDAGGNLVLAFSDRLRRIVGGNIETLALFGGGDITRAGSDLLVTDGEVVARIVPPSTRTVVAGGATAQTLDLGDGRPAVLATLQAPSSVVVDAAGAMYIADTGSNRVRKVDLAGNISTFAGTGDAGYSGDGASGTSAKLNAPTGLALDGVGNLYIADRGNHVVRRVDTAGTISTVAGTGTVGSSGDGGLATSAQLTQPQALALDAGGNLYIADHAAGVVRRVTPVGVISTFAGGGAFAASPMGTPATAVDVDPAAIALDTQGNLFIADDAQFGTEVVRVDASGTAYPWLDVFNESFTSPGYSVSARFVGGIAMDEGGDTFVTNATKHAVLVKTAAGARTILAGHNLCMTLAAPPACPGSFSGDGGSGQAATLNQPSALFWDRPSGTLYVVDQGNNRIRAIAVAAPVPAPFAVAPQTGVPVAMPIVSAPVIPTGFRVPTTISVAGGDYSIGCTGTYAIAPGTLNPGESVCVRQQSSGLNNSATTAVLTVGGRSAGFFVRTVPGPGSASLSATSLDFGGQSINTSDGAMSVVVTNTGTQAIALNDIDAPAGYSATHDCASVGAGATCTITLRFAPGSAGTIAGTMTLHFSFGDQAVTLTGVGEKSLATHYYKAILRRDPDTAGKAFWDGEASRVAALGANPNEAWYAMAATFFGSPEYAAFARDDDGFLTDIYKTFFNRMPDADGLAYWKGQLAAGITRDMVIASFTFSPEFTGFTQAIFGSTAVRAENDMVTDMYRGFLQRLPDDAGFQFWTGKLRAAQCLPFSQQAAAVKQVVNDLTHQFLASAEYANRQRTDPQFLADLYNAIQRRGGDTGGVAYWLGRLSSNAQTRDAVLTDTVSFSPEFSYRVQRVLGQGCKS